MLTLDRYITGIALRTITAVVFTLLALISLFALFEEMDDAEAAYGLYEAGQYVLRTMPRRLEEILVYGLFLGYLIALGRLAESNELTILRVSGMSPLRIMSALLPSLALWLGISLVVSEYLAPEAERAAEVAKLKAQYGEDALDRRGGLWVRVEDTFMRVKAIGEAGEMFGVSQHVLNQDNVLTDVITAASGTFHTEREVWELRDGTHVILNPDGSAIASDFVMREWANPITPELLASQAFLDPSKMSMLALSRQIEFARAQQLGVSEYELVFWSRILKPLTYFGLTLFALAVVMGPLREVGMGLRLTFGIFAGLGFKYLQDLLAPAALVFNIPALIAILIPISIYWFVAWYLIRRSA